MSNKDFSIVLIEKGADVNYADDYNVTCTNQAAYLGLTSVVQKLVDFGADLDFANKEGITPLMSSSSEGHEDIVEVIIRAGGNVNKADKDGTTALMAAAVRGHKNIVSRLITHNGDVNAHNVDGHTALMFAYNGKNQLRTLLDKYHEYEYGANDNNTKILHDAVKNQENIITLLIKSGAVPGLQVFTSYKT